MLSKTLLKHSERGLLANQDRLGYYHFQPALTSQPYELLTWERRHLLSKRVKCCCDSDQIKHIPSHLGNLHVIPRLGWSFLHLQIAGADAREWQTSRFCWAGESWPETRCLDPTASREVRLPPSSAERMAASAVNTLHCTGEGHIKTCAIDVVFIYYWYLLCSCSCFTDDCEAGATIHHDHLTSLSSRWIPLISKSNMNNSATRLERQKYVTIIGQDFVIGYWYNCGER